MMEETEAERLETENEDCFGLILRCTLRFLPLLLGWKVQTVLI